MCIKKQIERSGEGARLYENTGAHRRGTRRKCGHAVGCGVGGASAVKLGAFVLGPQCIASARKLWKEISGPITQ